MTMATAAPATTSRSRGRALFQEYLGAEFKNVTFADMTVHPGVDFLPDVDIQSYVVTYSVFNSSSVSEQHELTKELKSKKNLINM